MPLVQLSSFEASAFNWHWEWHSPADTLIMKKNECYGRKNFFLRHAVVNPSEYRFNVDSLDIEKVSTKEPWKPRREIPWIFCMFFNICTSEG